MLRAAENRCAQLAVFAIMLQNISVSQIDALGYAACNENQTESTMTNTGQSEGFLRQSFPKQSRGRIWAEVLLVLGLSLGASAIYSVVDIINRTTQQKSLSQQTATLNGSLSPRPTFDLIYQFLALFFDIVPVLLVIFLLWPQISRLGISFKRPANTLLFGLGLALVIGIPGIGVYLGSRALGIGVTVVASTADTYWWTIPILVLSALRAALQEEIIVIGYLFARLRDLGFRTWTIILSAAVLRGSYHLYQGFGAFVGNFAMGVLFGWLYTRYGRVLPLVIAHFVIDTAIFVGYPWAASTFPALFGAG
jgi:membrane protease YdiL (CAAX protease family)